MVPACLKPEISLMGHISVKIRCSKYIVLCVKTMHLSRGLAIEVQRLNTILNLSLSTEVFSYLKLRTKIAGKMCAINMC